MGITNEATKYRDKETMSVRAAMEHRATWFYFLLDEARRRGLDPDEFARAGITKCGNFHAEKKIKANCPDMNDMREFSKVFLPEEIAKVLEADFIENTKDTLFLDFHHCPLVAAWQKLGCSQEDIELLCDIAMDGDRSIAEECGYALTIKSKIAEGAPTCRIDFNKKK